MIIKAGVTCDKCRRVIRGTITVEKARVVDSDGSAVFEREVVCDTCLGYVPHKKL